MLAVSADVECRMSFCAWASETPARARTNVTDFRRVTEFIAYLVDLDSGRVLVTRRWTKTREFSVHGYADSAMPPGVLVDWDLLEGLYMPASSIHCNRGQIEAQEVRQHDQPDPGQAIGVRRGNLPKLVFQSNDCRSSVWVCPRVLCMLLFMLVMWGGTCRVDLSRADAAEDDVVPATAWQYLKSRFRHAIEVARVDVSKYVGADRLVIVLGIPEEPLRAEAVSLGLLRTTLPSGEAEHVDIEAHALEVLGRPAPFGDDVGGGWVRVSPALERVLLAALCEAKGLVELSDRLKSQAQRLQRARYRKWRSVSGELEKLLFWNVHVEFGDGRIGWESLAADLDDYLELYPNGKYRREAEDLLPGVREVLEDDSLAKQARSDVEFLIHMLPWQNGGQMENPGKPDVFYGRCANSPASLLVMMGGRAVPVLAGALQDRRPTRTVGAYRMQAHSHYVLRVRDVVVQVLERMDGEHGLGLGVSWARPVNDDAAARIREKVNAWLDGR